MIMLNLGLGLWLANPAKPKPNPLLKVPNHWYPGFVYGVLRGGYRRDSRFLELSDGGHFDNLGLYELVRRQARVILVLDAESDPEFSFRALVSAAQRIKDDFRATIKFTPDDGPERLVGDSKLKYPNAAQAALSPYFLATIQYADETTGIIIYVKAAMVKNLSFISKGYKALHSDFPHQDTVDQFFAPEEVEAYREAGYRCVMLAIDDLNLKQNINAPDDISKIFATRSALRKAELT